MNHRIRNGLWLIAGAIGLMMLVVLTRDAVHRNSRASHRLILGEDFLPVYAAGQLVREGRAAELYAMQPLADIEREVVSQADLQPMPIYGPFFNPPFFAAAYVPFAKFPYRDALTVWVSLNVLLIAGSAMLLCRMLPPGQGWATWGLVVLLLLIPAPLWKALFYQQNTFLSLFLGCAIVYFWRKPITSSHPYSPDPSGLLCGLLFYKPQLALVIALGLIATRGRRAVIGLCITGSLLLLFTLIEMPGTLTGFFQAMPPIMHWMRTAMYYNWAHQTTPQSFWRVLIQGHVIGETTGWPNALAIATAAAFAIGLASAAFHCATRTEGQFGLDRFIAAVICSTPMLLPYYMDYDLMLLAIPAALFAGEWISVPTSITRSDQVLLGAWCSLFLELYVNSVMEGHARLNLAVPLIAIIAGISIARCFRSQPAIVENKVM